MVLSSVISVLFLPSFRILYGTLSTLMVRPLEPMVTSRLDITEKHSILTPTITSSNNSNTSSNSNNNITALTTTPTILTPRSISTRGTGLTSTLTTATDTRCPANQDRDSSLTVSFLSFHLSTHFWQSFSFPDSPYGDVSGLPDPYTGHDISDELQRQLTFDGTSNTGISLQSHDNQEGYSTPNRRVIREIIV